MAIVLGVVALFASHRTGRGLAVAGIVTGGIGLVFTLAAVLGLLLPAFGQARQGARTMKGLAQLQRIAVLIANDVDALPADADLEARYRLDAAAWVSPSASGAAKSYLRIVPDPDAATGAKVPILLENPEAVDAGQLAVAYSDGSVELCPRERVGSMLADAAPRVRRSDGAPWVPAGETRETTGQGRSDQSDNN